MNNAPRLFLLALAVAASATASPPISPQQAAPPRDARVDALAGRHFDDASPGGAIAVLQGGRVLHTAGYGVANLRSGARNTPDTAFHLASTSKQFTALAVLRLADAGKLSLEDPITRTLPELVRLEGVTIRHLLTHTSGLRDDDDALEDAYPVPTHATLVSWLAKSARLASKPGETFDYSNRGYELLGVVLERVSHTGYRELLESTLFRPLGMNHAFVHDPARQDPAGAATGYDYDEKRKRFVVDDASDFDNLLGSGSSYASLTDLVRYSAALDAGALVKPETLALAQSPLVREKGDGPGEGYGMGWEVGHHRGRLTVGHTGSWVGFVSAMVHFPEEKLRVIVLCNRDDIDTEALALDVADLYLAPRR